MTRLQRPTLPTANQLLNHLFENPKLIAAVRELPGPVLGRFIDSVGLEDAAELVALATTQQLESVFDEDLWQVGQGGWEERFEPARFALWLHAFNEAGEDAVVRRLLELPLEFVILAVHRLILVIDIDSLAVEMSSSSDDLDQVEKALESCLYEEWEEFRLIARDDSAWDEIIQALLALDRDNHSFLRQILERCAAMSSEWIDDNGGLYEVLSSDEMLESDVHAERDDRRAQKGYVSTADARAFLELARRGAGEPGVRDAITNAYFRDLARAPAKGAALRNRASVGSRANVTGLLRVLEETNVVDPAGARQHPKLMTKRIASNAIEARGFSGDDMPNLLEDALGNLRETDPDCYRERMEELAYLANVLIAAPQNQRQRLRPVEALESALRITSRGLEAALGVTRCDSYRESLRTATTVLGVTSADRLFRRAFPEMCSKGGR